MSEQVRDMFAEIADTYDSTNTVLSLGIHHFWRKKTVKESGAKEGHHVLDCATGTGDLAIEFRKTVGAEARVVGTDFCKEMVDLAPPKAKAAGFPDMEWDV
jgi:demethylmenaquinone methyltransferase/2-methoxy-6-polyprenyl-1,4-benzoquinol methylase